MYGMYVCMHMHNMEVCDPDLLLLDLFGLRHESQLLSTQPSPGIRLLLLERSHRSIELAIQLLQLPNIVHR